MKSAGPFLRWHVAALVAGSLGWAASSAAVWASAPGAKGTAPYVSPVDMPAAPDADAARSPLAALTSAGDRLVAVGLRGNIVYSDDSGKSWHQAQVPVQADLVAVSFATSMHGWAVGHEGVLLETLDGGTSWVRRFADQEISELARRYYADRHPAAGSAQARAEKSAAAAIAEKSPPSLLDVWFDSATHGTIVGTFNTLLRTEDGGKTWVPQMDRTDNAEDLHFYMVRGGVNGLYVVGERGMVLRLDEASGRWVAVSTHYAGTLFGLVANGADVLAYGMRGSAYFSNDAGANWSEVATPRKAGVVAGIQLRDGDVELADQAGGLIRGHMDSQRFTDLSLGRPANSLMQAADGSLWAAGPRGVALVAPGATKR